MLKSKETVSMTEFREIAEALALLQRLPSTDRIAITYYINIIRNGYTWRRYENARRGN